MECMKFTRDGLCKQSKFLLPLKPSIHSITTSPFHSFSQRSSPFFVLHSDIGPNRYHLPFAARLTLVESDIELPTGVRRPDQAFQVRWEGYRIESRAVVVGPFIALRHAAGSRLICTYIKRAVESGRRNWKAHDITFFFSASPRSSALAFLTPPLRAIRFCSIFKNAAPHPSISSDTINSHPISTTEQQQYLLIAICPTFLHITRKYGDQNLLRHRLARPCDGF